MSRPTHTLTTDRSFISFFIFTAISLGFYFIFALTSISSELNEVASKRDHRRTLPFILALLLGIPTLGLFTLWWWHTTCNRIGEELEARSCGYKFGAGTFWCWNFFGLLLMGLGPLVFVSKLFEAVNRINGDYNRFGYDYPDPNDYSRRIPVEELAGPEDNRAGDDAASHRTAPDREEGSGKRADESKETDCAPSVFRAWEPSDAALKPPAKRPEPAAENPKKPSQNQEKPAPKQANPAPVPERVRNDDSVSTFRLAAAPGRDSRFDGISLSCGKGHTNPPGSLYCSVCGEPLVIACPECGAAMPGTSAFCTQCGTDVKAFGSVASVMEDMESHASRAEWGAVADAAHGLPEKPQLFGERGRALLKRATELRATAEAKISECERDEREAEQVAESGEYADAAALLKRSAERYPGREATEERLRFFKDMSALVGKFKSVAAGEDVDGMAAALAEMRMSGMPEKPFAKFEEIFEQRRSEVRRIVAERESCAALEKAFDDALAAGRFADAATVAESAVAKETLALCPDSLKAEISRRGEKIADADARFRDATARGCESDAGTAIADLVKLGVPDSALEAARAGLARLRQILIEAIANANVRWKASFAKLDFPATRNMVAEFIDTSPQQDVRVYLEKVRVWLSDKDGAPARLERLVAAEVFDEALELLDALPSSGFIDGHDIAPVREAVLALQKAAKRRSAVALSIFIGVIAAIAGVIAVIGIIKSRAERNQWNLQLASQEKARFDDLYGKYARWAPMAGREVLTEDACVGYAAGTNAFAMNRGEEAINSLLDAAKQMHDLLLDVAEEACSAKMASARALLEKGDYAGAAAAANLALEISGETELVEQYGETGPWRDASMKARALCVEIECAPLLAKAKRAFLEKRWTDAKEAAEAVLAIDKTNVRGRKLRKEAVKNFKPVAVFAYRIEGGADTGAGDNSTLEGICRQLPRSKALSPAVPEPTHSTSLTIDGERYLAVFPDLDGIWDGEREVPVTVFWSPESGRARLELKLPKGDARGAAQTMAFRWCSPGFARLGSPSNEPGRPIYNNGSSLSSQNGIITASGPEGMEDARTAMIDGFWLAETEVTQGQWKQVMGGDLDQQVLKAIDENGLGAKGDSPEKWRGDLADNLPMYYVNKVEAMEFCRRLTETERAAGRLPEGFAYSLPTGDQWEYACRAGSTSSLQDGLSIEILGYANAPALDHIAWYGGNSSVGQSGRGWDTKDWKEKQYPGGYAAPRLVATRKANAWGLYDMLGNVWEWCIDDAGDGRFNGQSVMVWQRYELLFGSCNYETRTSPQRGWAALQCGGAWDCRPHDVRCARRLWRIAGHRSENAGFRVAIVRESPNSDWRAFRQHASQLIRFLR